MTEIATQELARARAAQIRAGIQNYLHTLSHIAAAYAQRDWKALGYDSWDRYVDGEYSEHRLKLSPEHRRKAVAELRLAGMPTRAIAGAIGVNRETVMKDIREVVGNQPTEIQGADGKTYASTRPSQPSATAEADDPARPAAEAEAAASEAPTVGAVGAGEDATGCDFGPVETTGAAGPSVVGPAASSGETDAAGSPDPVRVRLYVDTGFSGADHNDVLVIERAEWNALTPAERREQLADAAQTLMENHIEYGWLIDNDADYADTEDGAQS